MIENEYYRQYMILKRQEWKWWDQWLHQYSQRRPRFDNDVTRQKQKQKIDFFENAYIPLLAKFDIECERSTTK